MRGLANAVSVGLILIGGLSWTSARAQPVKAEEPAVEARARELLASGVEQSVTPQMLAKLGPALPDALLAIFERPSEARYVRLRALGLLAHYQQTRVMQLFARLLHDGLEAAPVDVADPLHPSRSTLVVRRAIAGLSTETAARHVARIELDLTRALQHRDAQVRRAAVLALQRFDRKTAREALALQRTRETSPLVLKVLTDRSARSPSPLPSAPKSATPPR